PGHHRLCHRQRLCALLRGLGLRRGGGGGERRLEGRRSPGGGQGDLRACARWARRGGRGRLLPRAARRLRAHGGDAGGAPLRTAGPGRARVPVADLPGIPLSPRAALTTSRPLAHSWPRRRTGAPRQRRAESEDGMMRPWRRPIRTWALIGVLIGTFVLAGAGAFVARAANPIKIGFGMALTGGL